jgi:hypothetical protein
MASQAKLSAVPSNFLLKRQGSIQQLLRQTSSVADLRPTHQIGKNKSTAELPRPADLDKPNLFSTNEMLKTFY